MNNTKFFQCIVLIIVLQLITGCSEDKKTIEDSIQLLKNEYAISSTGGVEYIVFTTAESWEAESSAEWVQLSISSGRSGDISLPINVRMNNGKEIRKSTLTIRAGGTTKVISIQQEGGDVQISEHYVSLDYEKITAGMDKQNGTVTLSFPNDYHLSFKDGQSIIVVKTNEEDFLRRVVKSNVNAGTATLKTEPAYLNEVFLDQEFTLTTALQDEPGARFTMNVAPWHTPSSYIRPVKILEKTKNGYLTIYDAKDSFTRGNGVIVGDRDLFDMVYDLSDTKLWESGPHSVLYKKYLLGFTLSAYFTFNFSSQIGNIPTPCSELNYFHFYLKGKASAEVELAYQLAKELELAEEEKLLKENIVNPWKVQFSVHGVPVSITLSSDLLYDWLIKVSGSLTVSGGFSTEADITAGVIYDGKTKEVKPIMDYKPQFTPIPVYYKTEATLHSEVSLYPRLSIMLYDFVGPWIDLIPYINTNMGHTYTSNNQLSIFNFDIHTGMKFREGLRLGFLKGTTDYLVIKKRAIENTDKIIFSYSDSIWCKTDPKQVIKANEETAVTFNVRDINLGEKEKSSPTQKALVKLESTGGSLSKDQLISSVDGDFIKTDEEGNVTVQWTPEQKGASLTAAILTPEGTVKKSIVYKPIIKSESPIAIKTNQHCTVRVITFDPKDDVTLYLDDEPYTKFSGNTSHGKVIPCGANSIITLDEIEKIKIVEILPIGPTDEVQAIKINSQYIEQIIVAAAAIDLANCTALKELNCWGSIDFLNLSGCSNLTHLTCRKGNLATLDISPCPQLKILDASYSQLKSLKVVDHNQLEKLICDFTPIVELELSNLAKLSLLSFRGCSFMKQLKVTDCEKLENIDCVQNEDSPIESIDLKGTRITESTIQSLRKLSKVEKFNAPYSIIVFDSYNDANKFPPNVKEVNLSHSTLLTLFEDLSFAGLEKLETIDCSRVVHKNSSNYDINITNCSSLKVLDCSNSPAATLLLGGCKALTRINAANTTMQLVTSVINATDCTALRILDLSGIINHLGESIAIPLWFKQLEGFAFPNDPRFIYISGEDRYVDRGSGWWYPGEPGSGHHGW